MYENTSSPQTSRISVRRSTPISQSCGHRRQRTFKRNAPRWTNNATRFWRTSPQSTRAWKRCVEQKTENQDQDYFLCVSLCCVWFYVRVLHYLTMSYSIYFEQGPKDNYTHFGCMLMFWELSLTLCFRTFKWPDDMAEMSWNDFKWVCYASPTRLWQTTRTMPPR